MKLLIKKCGNFSLRIIKIINIKFTPRDDLLNKFLALCLGEIFVLYKNYSTITTIIDNSDNSLLSKYKDYVINTGLSKKDSFNNLYYQLISLNHNLNKKEKESLY